MERFSFTADSNSRMSNEISQPLVVSLPLPEDTDRLGRAFARTLCARADEIRRTGLAIRLEGDLGAGKTSLVRAILRGLGYDVKDPQPGEGLNLQDIPEDALNKCFAQAGGAK